MLTHVADVGAYLHERLLDLQERRPVIGDVSGVGLVYGIEFVRDPQTKEPADRETDALVVEALRRGMLVCQASYYGNRITLMPPYTVEREDVDTIVDILDQSIGAVFGR
jgi:4-aminobutyrate aminotransferase-like enzyme